MYERKDAFYRRAKAQGYRSRAAFKLVQLAQRHRLFRRGDRVVDLGAWPGGWLQVAAQLVGERGTVVGVDLAALPAFSEPAIRTVIGDVTDDGVVARVGEICGGKIDVLLSDLAPKLSGVRTRDAARAAALAERALEWAERLLRPGGTLVVKLFTNVDLPAYRARLTHRFREVQISRPAATRAGSAEVYAVAKGFRGDSVTP